ncbi:hypothetical protein D9M71_427270 [compost metagenome]
MGDAAGELADRFHFLRLAQGLFGVAQALLLADPLADVVGEQVGTDQLPVGIMQRAETQFVMATLVTLAKLGYVDEGLTFERPCPEQQAAGAVFGMLGHQFRQAVADTRCQAENLPELVAGSAVDCQPAHVQIHYLDLRQGGFDHIGEDLAFCHCLGNPLFQLLVETPEGGFGALACSHILEQHRHLLAAGRLQAKGADVQVAAGDHQLLVKADRVAAVQHRTVAGNPAFRLIGDQLPQGLAYHVVDPGMLGVGGVGFDVDIVAERAVGAVEEFDDAKAFVHGLEQKSVTLLGVGQGLIVWLMACAVAFGQLFFEQIVLLLQLLKLLAKGLQFARRHARVPTWGLWQM